MGLSLGQGRGRAATRRGFPRARSAVLAALAAVTLSGCVWPSFGYNLANASAWRRPNDILSARFLKIGINFDF